jgi:hypothetical protein
MSQANHGPAPVTIIVNTRPHTWEAKEITFEQVVDLAYPGQPPNDLFLSFAIFGHSN